MTLPTHAVDPPPGQGVHRDPLGALVRARIRAADCQPMGQVEAWGELWFSPITGHCFAVPAVVNSRNAARDVLLQAGVDRAPPSRSDRIGALSPPAPSQAGP